MNGYENIPAHWEIARIKQKCRLIGSGTTPNTNQSSYYGGVINWIQSGDLYQKDFISFTERTVTESALQDYSALHIYKPPFIVVAMYGASIGNVAVSNITACVNQACCVLIPNKDVSMSYMFYWLKYYKEFFIAQSAGGSQTNISQRKIRNGVFLVPPIEEQRQIASFLDWKISGIDRLIAIRKDELTNLEDLKKAVITRAVTRGNWIMSKAKRYVRITNGNRPTTEGNIPVYGSGKKPFMTCGEYKTGPAVLLGRKGSIDNPVYVEGLYWNVDTAFDVKPLRDDLYIKYYYYLATRFDYGFYMTQTAIPSMTQTDYYNMIIPVPPISEQKRIAGYLDKICSEIDSAITNFTAQIDTLKELKARLISDTVTGKIDVRNIQVPEQEKIS